MAMIIPAILTNDLVDLERKLRLLEGFATAIHVDVEDGQFVPRRTLTLPELMAIPTTLVREYHLMVADPWPLIADPRAAGGGRLIIHVETIADPSRFLLDLPRAAAPLALAINPGTPLEPWWDLVRSIGRVMVMGVVPGRQGSPFIPETIVRIAKLRESIPNLEMTVDGGVNVDNAAELVAAGADRLVVGSAIWSAQDPAIAYQELVTSLVSPSA